MNFPNIPKGAFSDVMLPDLKVLRVYHSPPALIQEIVMSSALYLADFDSPQSLPCWAESFPEDSVLLSLDKREGGADGNFNIAVFFLHKKAEVPEHLLAGSIELSILGEPYIMMKNQC